MNKKSIKYIAKNFHDDIENKNIVITGGNSGIGFEAAKLFAYLHANVFLCVRNLEKGEKAKQEILKDISYANITILKLDISEEESIKEFVKQIIDMKLDIDVFYHNAGVYRIPFQVKEGKDIIIGTNFYGPLILSSLINPYLHSLPHEVKVIYTSSIAAKMTDVHTQDLLPNPNESRIRRYSLSKLLDAYLFKYLYLNDKSNIKYLLVHPGVTNTGLFRKAYKSKIFLFLVDIFLGVFGNPTWKSALATLKVIDKEIPAGTFLGPKNFFASSGYPKKIKFLDKRYIALEEIIHESEKICGYKLL